MRVRKPWDIPPGSQGCPGAGRQYARKRPRRGSGAKLLLALVTLCNVGPAGDHPGGAGPAGG